jgi:hypothetical protein
MPEPICLRFFSSRELIVLRCGRISTLPTFVMPRHGQKPSPVICLIGVFAYEKWINMSFVGIRFAILSFLHIIQCLSLLSVQICGALGPLIGCELGRT